MKRLTLAIAAALILAACDLNLTNTNNPLTPNGTSGNGGTSSPTTPTTPTASPIGTGVRTPDPIGGGILPLPEYGAKVSSDVNTALVFQSCSNTLYLDAVVDALRLRDTRWGYVCKRGNCADVSLDAVFYHAVAGPEVTGAAGGYVVDVIQNHCTAPMPQWLIIGFDPVAAWTGRGRF